MTQFTLFWCNFFGQFLHFCYWNRLLHLCSITVITIVIVIVVIIIIINISSSSKSSSSWSCCYQEVSTNPYSLLVIIIRILMIIVDQLVKSRGLGVEDQDAQPWRHHSTAMPMQCNTPCISTVFHLYFNAMQRTLYFNCISMQCNTPCISSNVIYYAM